MENLNEQQDIEIIPGSSEYWHIYNEAKREKKLNNIESSRKILIDHNITFTEHNNGIHFIVTHKNIRLDFWPSTGKIYDSTMKWKGRGIKTLLEYIGVTEPEQ